jgi:hypothetical protein
MADETQEELDAVEEHVQRRLKTERPDTFLHTMYLVGYVWLCFGGGWLNGFGEVLQTFLPSYFAAWNAIGISAGVGLLIAYRALNGSSWFERFHKNPEHRVLKPYRGISRGIIYFLVGLNSMAAAFWVIFKVGRF